MLLEKLLDPAVLGLLIPIVAILGGVGLALARLIMAHRERIAMIERGMHPDRPELEAGLEDEPAELPDPEQRSLGDRYRS